MKSFIAAIALFTIIVDGRGGGGMNDDRDPNGPVIYVEEKPITTWY